MPAGSPNVGRRRSPLIALPVLAALGLTACFSSGDRDARCDDPSEYQASRSVPPIVVPEGLAAPGRASSYTVPPPADTTADEAKATSGAACLARPPDFFRKDPAPAAK